MKPFIITVDTEGDNLWQWKYGDKINTENSVYLDRFQRLCDKYRFKPVYLTNYEMISDDRYVEFINRNLEKGNCEIGMHLHALNNPPEYNLENIEHENNVPYLIEYPKEVMEKKISVLTETIIEKTGVKPVSHRAGRWATNSEYFELLFKYGYKIDCSVTPNVSWITCKGQTMNSFGNDYTEYPEEPYKIFCDNNKSIYEIPMTIRTSNKFILPDNLTLKEIGRAIKHVFIRDVLWLRPNGKNLNKLIFLGDFIQKSKSKYLMLMIHSSELMPGGSPTFSTKEDIEVLYRHMEILFQHISEKFYGCTLKEYYEQLLEE